MTDVTDSGILTTASHLLFTVAGKAIFRRSMRGPARCSGKQTSAASINSGPMSYRVGNRQYCPVSGLSLFVFALEMWRGPLYFSWSATLAMPAFAQASSCS